jgi:O6-methylguanine-DNA--protein-cysteine methyltransferase
VKNDLNGKDNTALTKLIQPTQKAARLISSIMCLNVIKFFNFIEERGEMNTFSDKVYDLLRKVPKGRITTYKEIALTLENRAYRGVGQAMKRNPYAPEVP